MLSLLAPAFPPLLDLTSLSLIPFLHIHPAFVPLESLSLPGLSCSAISPLFWLPWPPPCPSSFAPDLWQTHIARLPRGAPILEATQTAPLWSHVCVGGVVPVVAPASQFIASRCWRVICCFIPSVCTMGPLWGAEQHPLEFRSNALTSAHPTHRALVSQRRTPSLHPPVLCPPGPSPHPPHGPTRIMALGEGDRTQTGASKARTPGSQGSLD